MSLYNVLQKKEKSLKDFVRTSYYRFFESKEVIRKSNLYKDVVWTDEEQTIFDDYWQALMGKKISNRWHKLYQSFNGIFCKEYIPEILYTSYIEAKLNDSTYARVFGNKGLIDLLLKSNDVIIPHNYCYTDGFHFYNHKHEVISEKEFWGILSNAGRIVVKPASCFGSGNGIMFLDMKDGIDQYTGNSISDIQKKLISSEIVVQEFYEQHDELAHICPKSMNTIRISTYVVNGEVHYAPIAMRCGSGESHLDNIHAGGLGLGLYDDGRAYNVAYKLGFSDICECYEEHPFTGVRFDQLKISNIEKVIDVACKLHGRTPHIGIIAWDFSISKDGTPVVIEQNFHGNGIWFPQIVTGRGFFGNDTAAIFSMTGLKNRMATVRTREEL